MRAVTVEVDTEKIDRLISKSGKSKRETAVEIGAASNYFSIIKRNGGRTSKVYATATASVLGCDIQDILSAKKEEKTVDLDGKSADALAAIETKVNQISQNTIIIKNENKEIFKKLESITAMVDALARLWGDSK